MNKAITTSKPLVVHVIESFGSGSFESLRSIVRATEGTHRSLIVHSIRAETPENFPELFPPSVEFEYLPMERTLSVSKDLRIVRELRKIFLAEQPSYIHAHSSKAGGLARLAAIGLPTNVAYSPRGYSFLMTDSSWLKRSLFYSLEYALGCSKATTVACGYDEGALARKVSRKVQVIPNTVRCSEVTFRERTRTESEPLRVVLVGRPSAQKGFDLFLDVARSTVDLPIRYHWLGGAGTEESLPGNVEVMGWLSHDEIISQLYSAHVFMSTSRWEGLPRSVLEAMGTGLPVVLSSISGHKELAREGHGMIVTDWKQVSQVFDQILNSPDWLPSASRAARLFIEQNYDERENSWGKFYSGLEPNSQPSLASE